MPIHSTHILPLWSFPFTWIVSGDTSRGYGLLNVSLGHRDPRVDVEAVDIVPSCIRHASTYKIPRHLRVHPLAVIARDVTRDEVPSTWRFQALGNTRNFIYTSFIDQVDRFGQKTWDWYIVLRCEWTALVVLQNPARWRHFICPRMNEQHAHIVKLCYRLTDGIVSIIAT